MIKKILLTTIALIIICLTILIVNKEESNNEINITVKLVKEELVETKNLVITNDKSLFEILNENYDIEITNGFIYKIGFLEAYDNNEAYIAIYVNGSYANKGIQTLTLNDNDVLMFEYTNI